MKEKKTIAAETSDPLAGMSDEQILAIGKRLKEAERAVERDASLKQRGLARGDSVGVYEVLSEGMDLNRINTGGDVLEEKLPLPKRSVIGTFVEIPEGGWIPRNAARKLSDEEIAAAANEGRLTLQGVARLRAKERPMTAADASLRAIEVDLDAAEAALRSAGERKVVLVAEREARKARLAVAKAVFEGAFEGRSPQWRKRVIEALAGAARDALPPAPPPEERAKAYFAPREDGGKDFRWNSATGQHERVR